MSSYMRVKFIKLDENNKLVQCGDREKEVDFAYSQDYAFYAFLGWDLRNYAAIPALGAHREPTKEEKEQLHLHADYDDYLLIPVQSLLDFDWDQEVEDRRCSIHTGPNSYSGASTCPPGEGIKDTYKNMFRWFYERLYYLKECDATYLLCMFDY